MKTKLIAIVLLISFMSACATVNTRFFVDSNGLKNYQIKCGTDSFYCLEEAGKICGARGYHLPFSSSSVMYWDDIQKQNVMTIICNV